MKLQRRSLIVLAAGTILSGLGIGASVSVGALLMAEVSGNDAISGLASTMNAVGAAIAGIPLARLAARRGRRPALVIGSLVATGGAFIAILAAVLMHWVLLLVALGLLGVASAVQLLSRFAATDLAAPRQRARDLSLVVWSITIGAVVGPNLIGPGAIVGNAIGIPPLSGAFVFTIIAQAGATIVIWVWLRPDPLLRSRELAVAVGNTDANRAFPEPFSDRLSQVLTIFAVAAAQAVMVALMAMTPLHLTHHDGSPEIVGFTISLHIAGMFAFAPLFGTLASRLGRVPVIHLGWVLLLASCVVAYVSGPSHALVQVSLFFLGLGWSAVTVAGAALITELTVLKDRPRVQGQSDTYMNVAGAIAGALSGVVFAVGDFALLAVAAVCVLLAGALATVAISLRGRHSLPHTDTDRITAE